MSTSVGSQSASLPRRPDRTDGDFVKFGRRCDRQRGRARFMQTTRSASSAAFHLGRMRTTVRRSTIPPPASHRDRRTLRNWQALTFPRIRDQSMSNNLLHGDLSEAAINAFYHVYNTLGYGFLPSVYSK